MSHNVPTDQDCDDRDPRWDPTAGDVVSLPCDDRRDGRFTAYHVEMVEGTTIHVSCVALHKVRKNISLDVWRKLMRGAHVGLIKQEELSNG